MPASANARATAGGRAACAALVTNESSSAAKVRCARIAKRTCVAVAISDVHRLECLVGPITLGDALSLAEYNAFFANVEVLPITTAVWERSVRIRATYGFKPLDSLHLAAATENGCNLFLTNDASLAGFPDTTVEILH